MLCIVIDLVKEKESIVLERQIVKPTNIHNMHRDIYACLHIMYCLCKFNFEEKATSASKLFRGQETVVQ